MVFEYDEGVVDLVYATKIFYMLQWLLDKINILM